MKSFVHPALGPVAAGAPPDLAGTENYVVAMKPLDYFKHSEAVDMEAVMALARRIEQEGVWSTALPVDGPSGYVMDGNHRLAVARLLGLRHLPCIPLAYHDKRVSVRHWRTGEPFSREELSSLIKTSALLPYKTTKHQFMPSLPRLEFPLELLRLPFDARPLSRGQEAPGQYATMERDNMAMGQPG